MGLLNRLGKNFVYRKCPSGRIHNVNKDNGSCGHSGIILDWCEEYRRWIPNPTKTAYAKDLIETDDEFAVEREARLRLEEAMKSGDIRPVMDMRRRLMEE